ncbi:RagB/SusD family nutrient uptake outer membrane protein [Mucilaginibacter sabulilitoris]|uniref:RagB/SusD family nutrient uptake outer membrane protein n=1 Tax=Mucilaginibacter sabulilitoris TaxID=1173583 RepID=A0ABZ0TH97_9SPHI|nr:RagB/SusD family nutrient uptake outer membrane protein [Mucilaginibacter sabulilitoris]WPU91608.1 RagB/SusD family nutrient uptake outer membrane protein [Mucilaginibacter sabulilitoris]
MSNLKYIAAVSVLMITALTACKSNLDEVVYSDVTSTTYKYDNTNAAIGIVYAKMRDMFGHQNYYMLEETTSDELVMPANASGWDDGGIYKHMHLHTYNSEDPQLNNMFNTFYSGIINCNRIIEQIEKGTIAPVAGSSKEALLGEMRTVRAFYYWLVCDNFGNAPLVTTSGKELPQMTARKDIYDFVVTELTASIPALSEVQDKTMYGRFNKWAAKALLANVYLNAQVYAGQAKWAECLAQCNDIVGKYTLENNYSDIFKTQNENSPEIVFAIPFDQTLAQGLFTEMYSWHGALKGKKNMQATPWGSGSAMGISQFIDTYSANDERLNDTWLIGPQFGTDGKPLLGSYDQAGKPLNFTKDIPNGLFTGESEGYRMNKFEVQLGAMSNLSNDFPFFRYGQVLMMKAECLLRTGDAAQAAALVTQVRARAFKKNPAEAAVTAADLTKNTVYKYGYVENYKIVDPADQSTVQYGGFLDQLGYEFAWEGFRRRDDIRFGVYTKKSWLSHKPKGDDKIIFPLPQQALNSNPNLKQNPGY